MASFLRFLSSVRAFAKQNPALVAGDVSMLVTLLSAFGLHVSTSQLAVIVSTVVTILAGVVHMAGSPAAGPVSKGDRG